MKSVGTLIQKKKDADNSTMVVVGEMITTLRLKMLVLTGVNEKPKFQQPPYPIIINWSHSDKNIVCYSQILVHVVH